VGVYTNHWELPAVTTSVLTGERVVRKKTRGIVGLVSSRSEGRLKRTTRTSTAGRRAP